jgi:hypothetical protein
MSMRSTVRGLVIALALTGFVVSDASAQYVADPFEFVGTSAECGGPAGARIVTALWNTGLGLPDNGAAHPAGRNAHQGLLLSKNGPTPNCSSAGAEINGITAGDPLTGLGFDFRRGSHCGAGAPRFNVYTAADFSQGYFFGCTSGAHTDAPQDPAQWERVRFSGADGFPFGTAAPFVFGVTPVYRIDLVFDEGTDTAILAPPGATDVEGIGLTTLDNLLINSTLIRKKGNNPITP